jgi:hypothetical protein
MGHEPKGEEIDMEVRVIGIDIATLFSDPWD